MLKIFSAAASHPALGLKVVIYLINLAAFARPVGAEPVTLVHARRWHCLTRPTVNISSRRLLRRQRHLGVPLGHGLGTHTQHSL
jgi:hypothetical protein